MDVNFRAAVARALPLLLCMLALLMTPMQAQAGGSIFLSRNCWNNTTYVDLLKPYATVKPQHSKGCFETPREVLQAYCRYRQTDSQVKGCEVAQPPAWDGVDIEVQPGGAVRLTGEKDNQWLEGLGTVWWGGCPSGSVPRGAAFPLECGCPPVTGANGAHTDCLPAIPVPVASNGPCPCAGGPAVGNPIYPLLGVKRETVDLGVEIGGLRLQLTYDSTPLVAKTPATLDDGTHETLQGTSLLGGSVWQASMFRRVVWGRFGEDGQPTLASVGRGDGRFVTLSGGAGQMRAVGGGVERMTGRTLFDDVAAGAQESYGTDGQLIAIAWVDGRRVTLSYSDAATPAAVAPGPGYLIGIAEVHEAEGTGQGQGRRVSLSYRDGRLERIVDADGGVITLDYSLGEPLSSIRWADGSLRRFNYVGDSPRALAGLLVGIIDERGVRYASFGYDAQGVAISSEHAGGVQRTTTHYEKPPGIEIEDEPGEREVTRTYRWRAPEGVVVTDARGSSAWTASSLNGHSFLSSRTQPGGGSTAISSQTYDASGNLASREDFNGQRSCFASEPAHNRERVRVEGLASPQDCDAVTAEAAMLPPGARKTSTQWHPKWNLVTREAAPGTLTTNVYNGQPDPFNGNAVARCAPASATLPDASPIAVLCRQVVQETTDEDGHLGLEAPVRTGSTGQVSRWTYNRDGQVLSFTEGSAIDGSGDGSGTTTYTYYPDTTAEHTLGDLQGITPPSGFGTRFTRYNRAGQVLQSVEANGRQTDTTYDARGRVLSRREGDETTRYQYDEIGQLRQVTWPDGSWLAHEYDSAHRRVASHDSQGARVEEVLDAADQVLQQRVMDRTGQLVQATQRTLDALGRVRQQTQAGTPRTYADAGQLWLPVAADGGSFQTVGTWTVRYGADARWVQGSVQTQVSGPAVCSSNLFGVDPAPGAAKRCERADTAGPQAGEGRWSELGAEGSVLQASGTWEVRYGADTRWIVRQVTGSFTCGLAYFGTDPAVGTPKRCQRNTPTVSALPASPGMASSADYDAEGHPTRLTQAPGELNLQTTLGWDGLYRVVSHVDAQAGRTDIAYDGGDRPTQVTDPRRLVTRYERNGFGDVTQLSSPDTGSSRFSHDEAGRLKTATDSRGVLQTHAYDGQGRRTSVVYSQAGQDSRTLAWFYDQRGDQGGEGQANGLGRLGRSEHPGGSTRYAYTLQGRIAQVGQVVKPGVGNNAGANSVPVSSVVRYGYTQGRLTSIGYPSGRQLRIDWRDGEPAGLSLASGGDGSSPQKLVSDIVWEPFGLGLRRWEWAMANGPQLYARFHDQAGRLLRYPLGGESDGVLRDLSYDAAGRITGYAHQGFDGTPRPALNQAFVYDENSRLMTVIAGNAIWSIGHDANGNRTSVSLSGQGSSYTTEATSNRLTSISNPARSFGYDAAGNTTLDSANHTATYDLRGQLHTITRGSTTARYTYDADGRRVRKVVTSGSSTTTTIFVYDLDGQLLGEYDGQGKPIREYAWLKHIPVAMWAADPANPSGAPLVYFIHTDHLNTPRVVVDRNGKTRWRWLAEPFGTTAPETNPSGLGDFVQNLRMPGQYADAESGLWYNYFRYYDSTTGRYSQSDPIGLDGGINGYSYAGANPVSMIDPDGLYYFIAPLASYILSGGSLAVETGAVLTAAGTTAIGVGAASGVLGAPAGTPPGTNGNICPAANDNDCAVLLFRMRVQMGLLNKRYRHFINDRKGKQSLTGEVPEGYVIAWGNLKNGLRKIINEALEKGCPIPPEAMEWLNLPIPSFGQPYSAPKRF